jgi:hypothetical protein
MSNCPSGSGVNGAILMDQQVIDIENASIIADNLLGLKRHFTPYGELP